MAIQLSFGIEVAVIELPTVDRTLFDMGELALSLGQ